MIICDTHPLIFDVLNPRELSVPALRAIESGYAAGELACADISLWEIAMLIEKGRIKVDMEIAGFLNRMVLARKIQVLPITPTVAAIANSDAVPRGDLADRLIAATAITHGAPLITRDKRLSNVPNLRTIW